MTNCNQQPKISDYLKSIKFHHSLEEIAAIATAEKHDSHLIFLEKLLSEEKKLRSLKSLNKREKDAKLGIFKKAEEFDWNLIQGITHDEYYCLSRLSFFDDHSNIILLGACGLGKTMIAKNLGYLAARKGMTVRFITVNELLLELRSIDSAAQLKRRLDHYKKLPLLILDELGYVSFTQADGDLLFQLLNMRYENHPTIITSNLPLSEWPDIFPGSKSIPALIDRMIHHSKIYKLTGKSYRMAHASNSLEGEKYAS